MALSAISNTSIDVNIHILCIKIKLNGKVHQKSSAKFLSFFFFRSQYVWDHVTYRYDKLEALWLAQ